jgi:hypothetical protein
MALGPQQMPPQGARALVRALLGGRRRGPEVTATLDESDPDAVVLELLNLGTETAAGLRVTVDGVERQVGDLAPGAATRVHVRSASTDCTWECRDARGRRRRWRYARA